MLAPGSLAAAFQLESSEGDQVSLRGLTGKLVVLYFYPRDNTPGCTLEAQDFRDQLADFAAAGAVVFGISRDSIASHCKFRDKYGLTFPLLSDPDGSMMEAYQAWGEKMMYGKKVTGVIRSTVVIDEHGKIARHWPKVNVKGHAADVLAFVRTLSDGARTEATVAPTRRSPAKTRTKNSPVKTPTKKAVIMTPAKTPVKKAPAKTPVKKAPAKAPAAPAKTPVKKAPAKTPVKKAPAKPKK